jgi:hypothetical protein
MVHGTNFKENPMREFENGWPGVKSYAIEAGIVAPEDGDDTAAKKVLEALEEAAPLTAEEDEVEETGFLNS